MARSYLSIDTICCLCLITVSGLLACIFLSVLIGNSQRMSPSGYSQQVTVHDHTIYCVFQYYNGYEFSSVYIVQPDCVCLYTHLGQ